MSKAAVRNSNSAEVMNAGMEWFRRDPLLANVRNLPQFRQILEATAYRRQQRPTVPPIP